MVAIFIKRHKSMIRVSIFFFCIGCGIALCFLKIDCANAVNTENPVTARYGVTNGVEYAVLVLTSPLNEERRNVIRSTWAKFISNIFVENGERLYKWNHSWTEKQINHDFIKVYFVVGTKGLNTEKINMLKTENTRSNDMVLLDNLTDKYENLAMKMKLSFVWIHENLKNVKYVIKCDDDSFVRVDLIVKDLEAFAPQMNSYTLNTYTSTQVKVRLNIKAYIGDISMAMLASNGKGNGKNKIGSYVTTICHMHLVVVMSFLAISLILLPKMQII
ncbi:beta-1,3-galactosyltransferase 6-like isoform X2 [Leguminivora glycinivorella]|uniref:beta-1,3-galactosyltransferase 6-like isoform X2 n=1 Tax=Leguminivora glycinivorella TaxID=1035111 RepID=UPI00200FF871|nr:beta-1,3-galactosyltransferase 6-like isoform X2 [Leguminivora glycinivorella]